ncbi:hypothetical protein [Catellatospora tritici]|uniref:hypothetical protein n=1 Tax=Catellatospora tritici TaxID=2851566 RepID=UPI001C2CED19|nr:hypothetical protein [Catellatospora tritici]MBV1853661.1 hypothetical protein [Catellatospora tritici]
MMLRTARAALYTMLPLEAVIMVLLVSGVALPPLVVTGVEVLVPAVLVLQAVALWQVYRAQRRGGREPRAALRGAYEQLVPVRVRRLLSFDAQGMVSLVLWVTRRRHGVPPGATAASYHREVTVLMLGFLMASVIELVGVDILLRSWHAPGGLRAVVLAVDAYGILIALAVIACYVTRPHVISADEIRIRHGAFFDLRIPRTLVKASQHRRNHNETGMLRVADGVLALAVNSQTNLIVELSEPVLATRPLGRQVEVHTIRFFADDPATAYAALRADSFGETARNQPKIPAVSPNPQAPTPTQAGGAVSDLRR